MAEPVGRLDRIDDRAERLAHALAVERHEAVAENLPRQRQLRRHQHRRPDHRVEPRDVLADHVEIRGPPPARTAPRPSPRPDRRGVVDQRIEPDVDDAGRIPRERDAPRLTGAADRDVDQPALEQPQDLVAPDLGLDELRMRRRNDRAAAADTSTAGRSSSSRESTRASASDEAGTCRRRDPSPA